MPTISIRWADNTEQLRQHLREGTTAIEAMRASVDKTVRSMGGEGLFRAAHNLTAAIHELGGATKLTAQEQERASATLDKAIAKYHAMGQTAPLAMKNLANELRPQPGLLQSITDKLGPLASGLGLAFGSTAILTGIVSIGKAAIADADALEKMKDKTGIGVEALQRLRMAGDQSGNSIDELTSAVNKMQNNLAGGDSGAIAAIEKLGLNLEDLKRLAPEKQLVAIGDAIAGIKDPAKQVNIAMDIFGRTGAEILPTLKGGFQDLKDGTIVMSETATKALDDTGDAIARLWRNTKAVIGEATGRAIAAATGASNAAGETAGVLLEGGPSFTPFEAKDPSRGQSISGMAPGDIAAIQAPMLAVNAAGKALTITEAEAADAVKLLNDQLAISIPINQRASDALRKSEAAAKAFADSVHGLSFKKFTTDSLPLVGTLQGLPERTAEFRAQFEELAGTFNEFHDGLTIAGDTLNTVVIPAFGKLPDVVPAGTAAIEEATEATEKWSNVFKKFPDLLTAAFTGGGGLKGALKGLSNEISKSIFGKDGPLEGVTKSLTKSVMGATGFLGKTMSKMLGDLAGSLLPGLGGILASVLGKLSGIGGPNKEQKEARSTQADIVKQLQATATEAQKAEGALKDTYHTIAIVGRDAFLAVGQSAEEADQHIKDLLNTNDPAAFARGMQALTDAMQKQKDIAASVDGVVAAWQKAGSLIPASMQETIRNLIKMNGLTDAQRQKLQALLDSAKPDFEALRSEAEGFGISLEGLGPAFEQHDLENRVKKLTDFIKKATQAGGDMGGILAGTADEFSALVQEAQKFGTALPESTREYIEELIRAGKLLDEQGNKIEDVGAINFEATPLAQGLEDLNDTLKELVDTLNRLNGRNINATVNLDYTTSGNPQAGALPSPSGYDDNSIQFPGLGYASRGAFVTRHGLMPLSFSTGARYMATGGPVWPFIPRGTDTIPAMLSPGEMVIPAGRASLDTPGNVTLNVNGPLVDVMLPPGSDLYDADRVLGVINDGLRDNRRLIRTNIGRVAIRAVNSGTA